MPKAKSPLRYPGGKSRAVKFILPRVPQQFSELREPFVGGGSVFLAVQELAKNDLFLNHTQFTINDINPDLMSFWQMARDNVDTLVDCVTTYRQDYLQRGRDLYEYLRSDDYHLKTDLQRATRFFIMNRITFSGVMDAGGYSQQAFDKRFTVSSIDRLRAVSQHLQDINMHCDDYASIVNAAGQDVFIFLDPPYYSATKSRLYGKRGELHTGFDHERFAQVMRDCSHQWLITYDDSDYIRELFSFAHIERWQLQYGMNNVNSDTAAKGQEIFIKNY